MAVHRRDEVDEPECRESSALPANRKHKASHDDRGGAVGTTASDRRAGAPPLRWDLATERRGVAGDHKATRSACLYRSPHRCHSASLDGERSRWPPLLPPRDLASYFGPGKASIASRTASATCSAVQ